MKLTAPNGDWSAPVALGDEAFEQIDVYNATEGGSAVRIRFDDSAKPDAESSGHDYCPSETLRRCGFTTPKGKRRISLFGVTAEVDVEVIATRTSAPVDDLVNVRRGPAGADGADGADGAAGADGADGANGADGADGADGVDVTATCVVSAYLNTDNVVAVGTTEDIIFDVEDLDIGGDYSITNGEFTAPADGTYRIAATASYSGAVDAYLLLKTERGGGWDTEYQTRVNTGAAGAVSGAWLVDLSAGDKAKLSFTSASAEGTLLGYTDNGDIKHCHLGIDRVR